jgi:hypothetical protein
MSKVQKIPVGMRSVLVPRILKGVFQRSEDEPLFGVAAVPAAGSIVSFGPLTSDQLQRQYTSTAAENQLPFIRLRIQRETAISVRG